jgi:tyrosyl-tRNA synthetase
VTRASQAELLTELRWRGMLAETTPSLQARLASGRRIAGYNGFDPSGPSLHVGHLVPVFGLMHLQRHGGRPYALIGGATGMVGDPSGRSAERILLDGETLATNLAGVRAQLERFLDFGPDGAMLVNNLDWLGRVTMLDFLRDVGKHFTVPYMLAKDSVQVRLDRGLSYTEFSYMLLQAADFLHLYREHGVELQMGGADQWGNITAGLELIRRVEAPGAGESPAHGIAYQLLTDTTGEKFGKTAAGTSVWLDPARTTPFAFYQWWLAADDADVGRLLRFFTLLGHEEIEDLERRTREAPEAREAQRALARDVTARVHGDTAAGEVIAASEAAFSGEPITDPAVLATLFGAVESFTFSDSDAAGTVVAFLTASGTVGSKSEARRLIAQGGLTINDERISDAEAAISPPIADEWIVVRVGKRRLRIGRRMAGRV